MVKITKEHTLGAGIAALAALLPIVGGSFALDARYEKAVDAEKRADILLAQAGEKHYQQDVRREEGDLRTQLALINLEIEFLTSKEVLTSSDQNRLDYLTQQRGVILARLRELES